jgi:hypothetical protein
MDLEVLSVKYTQGCRVGIIDDHGTFMVLLDFVIFSKESGYLFPIISIYYFLWL